MALICPNITGLEQDEQFQVLKERYKDRDLSDFELATALQVYREETDLDIDWYPTSQTDYAGFTDFLDRSFGNLTAPTVSKESLKELYKTITTLYSPAMLNNRIDRIATLFSDYVTKLVGASTFGVTRQQVIQKQAKGDRNGFDVILGKVFDYIKRLSTVEGQIQLYKHNNPNLTDEQIESKKEHLTKRAEEFAKIYENRDSLGMLAALRIGAKEGFSINIDGLQYDVADMEELDSMMEQEEEDDGVDSAEAMKGDRYVDYRTFNLSSTLSTEARRLLEDMVQMDNKGNVVYDDLDYPVRVNIRQAIVALHKTLQVSTPEAMMSDLQKAVKNYPWIKGLIDRLQKKPDERALVYSNFKKSRAAYYYSYKDKNGKLVARQINNVADGKGLSREAGVTLGTGIASSEQYSVVDNTGKLVSEEKFSTIENVVNGLKDYSRKQLSVKAKSTQDTNFTSKDTVADWRNSVNEKPVSDFNELTDVLRGLGFNLSAEEVKYAISESAPIASITGTQKKKPGDITPQVSSLDRLLTSVSEILNRAKYLLKDGEDLTGSHLYNYAQDEYRNIADILSAIQRDEVEERSLSMSKSLASATTPSALRELSDKLSNVAGLSDADYRQMIMNDYGQYEGMSIGYGNDLKLTGWLADLVNDGREGSDSSYKTMRKSFKVIDFTDQRINQNKDFAHMTSEEHLVNSYILYTRGTEGRTSGLSGHLYEVPIQADYETAYNFIAAPSYSYNELVERLAQEVECEVQRIAAINERKANDPAGEPVRAIANVYEKRGIQFQIFPEMNSNGFVERYKSASVQDAHSVVKQEVDKQLRQMIASERTKLADMGMFKRANLKLMGIKSSDDKSINEWIVNSFYARQQMTKLMFGGLEHFKSTSDFEKRNMYSHAQRLPLYTKATYRGEQVGKENQRVLYLVDDESRSAFFNQIVSVADRLFSEGKLSAEQRDAMNAAYENITTTDGQGFRTLDSMRQVKIMASIWEDSDEVAYQHIKSGNYTPEDVQHFIIGIKPVYTGYEVLPAQPGQYQKPVRVPVLHKYSEMVLLPEMLNGVDAQSSTSPLKAFNELNKALGKGNEIDLFLFGSGVKVGANSVIDVFAKDKDGNRILRNSNSISSYLSDLIKGKGFFVHNLPYKYYGITSSMHADVADKSIAWATQAEKEAWGNIRTEDENGKTITEMIDVNGKPMKATDARELFYRIKAARTIDTFKRLNTRLRDKVEIAKMLKEEIASKPYKSRELLFALQMRDNGTYAYPLFSPNIQHDVTALLSSIIRKEFTKVPTKGANITQTTSFGMDQEFGQAAFDETLTSAGFEPLEVKFDENGKFQYVEAYLPMYDSRLVQFADKNGNITPKRLAELEKAGVIPSSILNFIAYRTPSDAEHSVIPCRVKGFISNVAGPSIRLPREIMKMTGHDYDGDKMRCHFKEFYEGWNEKQIKKDFERFSNTEVIKAILDDKSDPTLTPYELFRRNVTAETNPDSGKYRALKDVRYDYGKQPLDNIKNGDYTPLNNALVDLMFAQLTSENGGLKMFIPGGAEETKKYADTIGTRKSAATNVSPFTVSHATESHDYMMDGAGMIGIYAMYNSAAAMMQRLDLHYISDTDKDGNEIPVRIFGKTIDKLYPVISDKNFTTLGMSRLLNAAVDNGKDPLLGYLNQTSGLAGLTNFLLAAGINEGELHLLFNQPVMKEMSKLLKDGSISFSDAAKSLVNIMTERLSQMGGKKTYYKKDSLARMAAIGKGQLKAHLGKSFDNILNGTSLEIEDQINVLQTMQHINPAASDLEQFVKLTRPESSSGGVAATLGGIISKVIQLDNFRERLAGQGEPVRISGISDVLNARDIQASSMTPKMIEQEIGNNLPEVVALNSLMKDNILNIMREYFPQARESWLRVEQRIASQYSYANAPESVINRIGNDMILYKLLSDSSFITGNPQEEQKRIIEDVPKQLRALKERIDNARKNPGKDSAADALVNNIFIKNLELGSTIGVDNTSIDRIRFRMNGASLEDTADTIRADWGAMLYSSDKDIKQLAQDLFKYNLYTNGFSYGMYEFAHYAPASVIFSTPGYISALNKVLDSDWSAEDEEMFFHQYILNHWGDKKLLKTFTPDKLPVGIRETLGFKGAPGKAVDQKTFNDQVGDAPYMIVRTITNNVTKDTVYSLIRDNFGNIVDIAEAPKMGIQNRNKQVIVQYNPRVRDISELKPVFTGNNVAWEGRSSSSDEGSDVVDAQAAAMNYDEDYDFNIPIKPTTAETVKKLDDETAKAAKINGGKLTAEMAAELGLDDEMFYLVNRDENGNIVPGYYSATPEVVEQARAQQTFHDLNVKLRKILSEHGVKVGVLEEAEARLMAGGVADFSAASTLVDGMCELIRIANGVEGEYALPEEFAHVAVEMLGHDHPLVQRLFNVLRNDESALKEAYGGQYEQYQDAYKDNTEKLITEAAGKLIAKQLFQQQYVKTPSARNLVQRICDAIKNFFRKFNVRELQDAKFESEKIASQLARDLLSGRLADELKLEKITSKEKFFNLNKDISDKSDILSKLEQNTAKRRDILQKRMKYSLGKGATSRSLDVTKAQLEKLEKARQNQKLETTVIDYLRDTLAFMSEMEKSLDATINNRPANAVCKKLQIVKDTLLGFSSVQKDIRDAIASGELQDDVDLKSAVREVSNAVEDFWTKYNNISMMYFEQFLSGVYGKDGVTVTIGRDKGRHISIEEMARKADRDIGWGSRWLAAVSDCNDYVLQAIDDVTREAKYAARDRVRELRPKLEAAFDALVNEQGNRDQSWMFDRKLVDGKMARTGKYISRAQVAKMSDARKNFYDVFMELKKEADRCVPETMLDADGRKIIMLRKEHYEKMREAQGVKGKAGEEWENVKRSILEMGDIDYENEVVQEDFGGNIVDSLPLKFLNKGKNESFDDMTEDAATSLMAYLGMAFEYQEMGNVIGMLENARYASSMRDVKQRRGFRNLIEKIGGENEIHYTKPHTVKQAKTNIQKAMNDFFQMHVYGHLEKDEGTIGKTRISRRKATNALIGYTSLAQMALNLHQRIANINTGLTQIVVETAGSKIKAKDVGWASAIWMKESADRLAETGKTDYDNKLSLWMDYFDIHQDNGRENRTTKYGRSNASRAFNTHLLYAGLSVGEDYLSGTTALAYARNFKMKGPNGEDANLWDAYEVAYVNPAEKTGAYLKLKDGYTKADGTALTKEDERKFMKEVVATNFELQGIYNVDDRSAWQQHSLGALAIMYRKWIAPAFKRRYAGVQYSALKGEYTEGYYTTAARTAKDIVKDWFTPVSEEEANRTVWQILTDLQAMKNSITLNWSKLNDYEKGNIRKASREMLVVFGLIAASALMAKLPPVDDDDNKFLAWADDLLYTQILRLRSEIGSQAPTPNMLNEALRILSSPFAALKPLAQSLNILKLAYIPNYFQEVESGRYKGRTKAHKYLMTSPLVALFRKLDNFVDPSDLINYYKNQNY